MRYGDCPLTDWLRYFLHVNQLASQPMRLGGISKEHGCGDVVVLQLKSG